jgi:glycosyltransferase involved in cell wall biosynthesis
MRFLMLNWRDPHNPMAGGAERVTWGYLTALQARGHEVFCFTFQYPGAGPEESISGIQVVRGGGTGTAISKAIRWYRQQPPFDLVIDQHHGIPWFAPWWCRTRCVAYVHEVLGPIWTSFYPRSIAAMGQAQERWTHWLYRKIPFFTGSNATKIRLQKHGVRNVTVIPYGVDTIALLELPPKPLQLPLRLLVVSRLAPNKRIDQAVLTLKCLLRQGTDATLTIIGTGELESQLRQLVQREQLTKSVIFTGKLSEEEKDHFLQEAHFLLHTSLREGWGLNVIEANAMGTPAAVYPVEGLVESTLHNETGWVASEETPESLAEGLLRLSRDPERYQRYRVAAWKRARQFHWSQILPQATVWFEAQAKVEK